MSEHTFEGTATEALAFVSTQEGKCKEELAICDAVIRLSTNPDFKVLVKDFEDIAVAMTKALAYPQTAEPASKTLSGIARFFELLESYPAKRTQAQLGLESCAESRQEIMESVQAEGEA